MISKPIPYGRQHITDEDIRAVIDPLKSDYLTPVSYTHLCLFIDTPGFDDDEGELGGMRVERTLKTGEKADIALLLYEADGTLEQQWLKLLAAREIPVILIPVSYTHLRS